MVIPTDPSQPFGNAPRNNVRGPLFLATGRGAVQAHRLAETSGHFEFRFEVFNLLNRANFRAPNGNRSAAAFGTITSTYQPRQAQIGLKVSF